MKIILEKSNRGIALQQAGAIPSDVVTFMLANYIKLNWRCAWSSESTYNYNDAVSYLGSSYVALRATTEQPGESAADWKLIAKKGEDGRGIVSFDLFDVQEKTKTYRLLYTDATYVDIAIIDGNDGVDGLTPYIGMNGNWWIGDVDQNIKAEGVDGISPTIGLNGNWYLGTTDTGVKAQATSAYEIYLAGGGTLSEVDFNASITNIPSHIADDSIHHTFDEIRDDIGINEETGSESKFLNEKGDMTEIVIGSGGYSAHVYATTINSDITGYKKSSYTAETSETVISTTLSNSTVLVEEYIFDSHLGITQIPNGSWLFHYYAKIGATNPQGAKLRFAVYTRGTTGTETLLFTKDTPTFTNTDYIQVLPVEFIGNLYTCLATDRIVFKVYVVTTSVPNVTVSYIVGDGRGLYVDSPIQLRHSQTREKNEELAYQHIDTATAFSGLIDETNDKLAIWDESLNKWVIFSFSEFKTFLATYHLKLDQTIPQTITGNVNINGNVNAVTTNVNQYTLPSVNASQDAAILQDGSAFTGTAYVMPTNNVAVKFVASASHTMGDFTIRVKSSATLTSTTATLRGYLYSDNAGSPGTLLATGNAILHGSITTSYQELSLGTQYNLVAGTTYWLVIRWNSAPTGGNIIFDSNTDTNGGATSADATSWTLTNVRLRYRLRGRTSYGNNAFSTNNIGVYGNSINNIGVNGSSINNIGVNGSSTNGFGVYGSSTNNFGVSGNSTNSIGVRGSSTNHYGVYGQSTNNIGVYGSSTNSYGIRGDSTNNRAGYFTRNTATPTSAVPVVEIIQDHASDTNSVLDVKQDGTGEIVRFFDSGVEVASIEKGGLGIYKKGVIIGDNTDVASYENRGATRYRENAGGSFYEMVMKKQDGSYAWTTIVSYQ